jgi:branched-chain amino acid transport system ATP-binding protein
MLLEIRRLCKCFGSLIVADDVDLEVEAGEAIGIIGPNGAGKTTLFNLISAALTPKSGTIHFKGENITGIKPYKICRKGVARTFQTVKIFPDLPVLQNVVLGAYFGNKTKMSSTGVVTYASEILAFVGLAKASAIPARDLTLANQKRLEVARALATDPELMLLDEIMAGLNQTEVAQAMELVKRILDKGVTVIMIEHVMKAIMNVCERIMVLHHGAKIAEGTPQEITSSETVIKVYLGDKARA